MIVTATVAKAVVEVIQNVTIVVLHHEENHHAEVVVAAAMWEIEAFRLRRIDAATMVVLRLVVNVNMVVKIIKMTTRI